MLRIDVDHLTTPQRGLISRHQALAAGLTSAGIRNRIDQGVWVRVDRGLYAIAGVRLDREHEVLGAILRVEGQAWASHATAARLWGFRDVDDDRTEITVLLHQRVKIPGVVAHRSGTLVEADLRELDGIPVLSPARTIVDLSARFGPSLLGKIVDDGLRRRVVSLPALHAVFRHLPSRAPGRSPVNLRRVLAERTAGFHPGDSELERTVLRAIVDAGLPAPVVQHRVRIGGNVYFLDLAYPDRRIAIEVDGFEYHHDRRAFDRDRVRQNDLVTDGWTVLRFTSTSTATEIVTTVTTSLCG